MTKTEKYKNHDIEITATKVDETSSFDALIRIFKDNGEIKYEGSPFPAESLYVEPYNAIEAGFKWARKWIDENIGG